MAASDGPRERDRSAAHGRRARTLVERARDAREHAVAPFSRFKVGAALEAADGAIITGCNIENASYGLTMCAERVAMFKAVSDGHRSFRRIAIVADTPEPTPPCGPCRQILWEYGGDLEVVLANLERETGHHRMHDLLPMPFDAGTLASGHPGDTAGTPTRAGRSTPTRRSKASVGRSAPRRNRLK